MGQNRIANKNNQRGILDMKTLRFLGAGAVLSLCAAGSLQAAQPACDRACLEGYVERYLDAVAVNNPSAVPLSPNVRFTEDGQRLLIGDGLWNTMKAKGKYRLFVTDVAAQQVAVLATIQEDHREPDKFNGSLIALRLRIGEGQITEIEQIVFRLAPDSAFGSYDRIDAMATNPLYLAAIPEKDRLSRARLIEQGNKYFTGLQRIDGKGD